MKLKYSPCRMDDLLHAEVSGDRLTLNGEAFDFSPLPDGATLPLSSINSQWVLSDVERKSGEIHLTLKLPHGENAPQETLFPENFEQYKTFHDGEIDLPPYTVLVTEDK